jgi:hypothetical protein
VMWLRQGRPSAVCTFATLAPGSGPGQALVAGVHSATSDRLTVVAEEPQAWTPVTSTGVTALGTPTQTNRGGNQGR